MPIYAPDEHSPDLPAAEKFWIAPDAHVIGQVRLGIDVGIWFGATVRGDNEPIVLLVPPALTTALADADADALRRAAEDPEEDLPTQQLGSSEASGGPAWSVPAAGSPVLTAQTCVRRPGAESLPLHPPVPARSGRDTTARGRTPTW